MTNPGYGNRRCERYGFQIARLQWVLCTKTEPGTLCAIAYGCNAFLFNSLAIQVPRV